MKKVDVAISFFRRYHYMPLVMWGLQRSFEHINKIIFVNGEDWAHYPNYGTRELFNEPPIWYRVASLNGLFTYSSMVNLGIAESDSIYTLHIDDDVILKEDTIPKMLEHARPDRFIAGTCYNIPEFSNPEDLEERDDVHELVHRSNNVPQSIATGPLWLVHTQNFLSMGGYDENLTEYADQDGEFILRWQTQYGTDKAVLSEATAYQIHVNRPQRPKPKDPYYYDIMKKRMDEWREARGGSYRPVRRPEGMVFENVR